MGIDAQVNRSAIHGPASCTATLYAMQFTFFIINVGCPGPVVPITALGGMQEMNSLQIPFSIDHLSMSTSNKTTSVATQP